MMIDWALFAKELEEGDPSFAPGASRRDDIVAMAENVDGVPVGMPVILLSGPKGGPNVWINGSVHGDEVLATKSIVDLVSSIVPESLAGRILAIPALNTSGFKSFSRESPYDGADMNRIWDKDPRSLGFTKTFSYFWIQRLRAIMDAFKPDCLIDVHDGGVALDIMSHVLYAASAEGYSPEIRDIAWSSGMKVIWRHEGLFFGGSSVGEANSRNIPGFIVESGGTGQLHERDIFEMLNGTKNILKKIKALPGEVEAHNTNQIEMVRGHWLRPEKGGVYERIAELGDHVKKGDLIGRVIDLFGNTLEEVLAPVEGLVFGVRRWGVCNVGDYIGNVGTLA